MERRVLIVGAGPAGLMLACELARRGFRPRIIDHTDFQSAGLRGKGLHPRSLDVLDDLGVLDKALASGNALFVSQQRTEEILRECLAEFDIIVETGMRLTVISQTEESVVAMLECRGELVPYPCAYLIGCDDGQVAVRRALAPSVDGVNVRMSERRRVGRAFLAGASDMNIGMQDASNLAWKLAMVMHGTAAPGLLGTYEEERLSVGALGYRGSSLSRDLNPHECRLKAGDRAPDAHCENAATGMPLRLFDAFRGTHFTLLGFGGACAGALQSVRARIADSNILIGLCSVVTESLRGSYSFAEGTLVLVRPDGYIGMIASAKDPDGIVAYLNNLGCQVAGPALRAGGMR